MRKVRNGLFGSLDDRVAVRMADSTWPNALHRAVNTTPLRPQSLLSPTTPFTVVYTPVPPRRRRPPPTSPLELQAPLELLGGPLGLVAPLRSTQKVVGPRGDPEREGRPWQWPAGRPFWSHPGRRR